MGVIGGGFPSTKEGKIEKRERVLLGRFRVGKRYIERVKTERSSRKDRNSTKRESFSNFVLIICNLKRNHSFLLFPYTIMI